MRIKDLLELQVLKDVKILTDNIGMTNEIESVMVLEAIDIEKWSRENQLILTSFYAFANISHEEVNLFFEKMKKIGVSGLIVKMDRLITMIPQWLIDLCFQYEIPLIKIEKDVNYEEIMLAIYEPILNHQSHLLRTYYDVRQRFMRVERNFSSFEQIMNELFQIINTPCSLVIPNLNIDISMGKSFDNFVVTAKEPIPNIEFTKNYYEHFQLFSQETNETFSGIKVNIVNTYADNCVLTMFKQNSKIQESKLMILENAVDAIYERLQMEYLIKKDRYTRLNNLADAILQNTPQNSDQLESLLEEANINQYPYYQGIAFSKSGLEKKPLEKKLRKYLRNLKSNSIFFEHRSYTIVLYNLKDTSQAISKSALQKSCRYLFDSDMLFTLAISDFKEKNQLKDILLECLDTIRFNQKFRIGNVVRYQDLGIFKSFTRNEQLETIEKLIPEDLLILANTKSELFQTLITYFQENRNFKRTAERLYLHPKTVRYRLSKIEKFLDIDLTNPVQLINFEIATYLLHLKKGATL